MKRKREADDYYSSERFSSKERKISNDPEGRVRTLSIERSEPNVDCSVKSKIRRDPNAIQIYDELRPSEGAMTFNSGDKESSSNAGDSIVSFNLISNEEADRIYQRLAAAQNQGVTTKRNWGHDEVKLLEFAVDKYCQSSNKGVNELSTKDWASIAIFVPGRTETQCLYKWKKRSKQKAFTKSTWSIQEDEHLKNIVNQFGPKNWQSIANTLNREIGQPNKRIGKQCRERWLNQLQPCINKDPWSQTEELVLLETYKRFPKQWAKIAKEIPGRTENMVKNRFNALSKKKKDELKMRSNKNCTLGEVLTKIENGPSSFGGDNQENEELSKLLQY